MHKNTTIMVWRHKSNQPLPGCWTTAVEKEKTMLESRVITQTISIITYKHKHGLYDENIPGY